MGGELGPEWLDESFVVLRQDKYLARGGSVDLELDYDPKRALDAHLCNRSLVNGDTCRLLVGHTEPHVPFSGELIATTGVYVRAVRPHQDHR